MVIFLPLAAFLAALFTLFAGFGLGTLLLPVFLWVFPPELALALTAVVHLLQNLAKFALFFKNIHWDTVIRFGLVAMAASVLGAHLALHLAALPVLWSSKTPVPIQVEGFKLLLALLLAIFVLLEWFDVLKNLPIPRRALPFGGFLSGFLGGLSGHQGAIRTAFLLRCGLEKSAFIATGVAISVVIDLSRLWVYRHQIVWGLEQKESLPLLLATTAAAILGVFVGKRIFEKTTLEGFQRTVALMLLSFAGALALGWV
jgi:hypothetical protein